MTPRRLLRLKLRAVASGEPVRVADERDACPDCIAEADLIIYPTGYVDAKVWHSASCPWLRQQRLAGGER
jgi:hypothetical protein